VKFGPVAIDDAEGSLLAHGVSIGTLRLGKGHVLAKADIVALKTAGLGSLIVARLSAEDCAEDDAAARIGAAFADPLIEARAASTGRVNLHARKAGVLRLSRRRVDAMNALDPSITIATLHGFAAVAAGAMVATVKIIPFAAPNAAVALAETLAGQALQLHPFRPLTAVLVQTRLPQTKVSVLAKTVDVTVRRIRDMGGTLMTLPHCAHDSAALAAAFGEARRHAPDVIIAFGASAVSDGEDVIPQAIRLAGGRVSQVGMPVDPGNLLVLGRIGRADVIGAPGCARSPKENGFDWVLARRFAGLKVTPHTIRRMGVGGLLMEIPSRPQPREAAANHGPMQEPADGDGG
jgi:molybdenum cofactor cytidylyltransferase